MANGEGSAKDLDPERALMAARHSYACAAAFDDRDSESCHARNAGYGTPSGTDSRSENRRPSSAPEHLKKKSASNRRLTSGLSGNTASKPPAESRQSNTSDGEVPDAMAASNRRAVLAKARKSCPVANPHSWLAGKLTRHADRRLFELCREDAFLSMPKALGVGKAAIVLKNIGYSLFQGRMLQPDFFASLDGYLKDIMLDGVERTLGPMFAVKFAKAVISGSFPIEYKKRVAEIMRNCYCPNDYFGVRSIRGASVFGGCSSFQEFMLGAVSSGKDASMGPRSSSFVLFLLCARPSWLRELGGIDDAEVAKWLDCADVLAVTEDPRG